MEGRDFTAPAHLLSERSALVHRAATRISSAGHSSVQHASHFPAGKYYPSHLQMPSHSGSGLVGNSSSSFMGSFLAGGLGSAPSHPPHPSRPPSSPSSHSGTSQIWFPHSHEAATGYPRFSGTLTHTFLPMGPLDHHPNSGVLYGQHRFYDTQKENFYLRGLSSQPLLSANHSMPPISRAGQGGGSSAKTPERGMSLSSRQKEPISSKQEAKHRQQQHQSHQLQQAQAPQNGQGPHQHHNQAQAHSQAQPQPQRQHQHTPQPPHQHHHSLHHQHGPHPTLSMEDSSMHPGALPPQAVATPLSACLLNSKSPSSHCSAVGPKSSSCGEGASGQFPERVRGEMRISEQPAAPADCVQREHSNLQHSLPYALPHTLPGAGGGGHPRGFHCLQFHPHHPHHGHYNPPHPDLLYPQPPAPLPNPPMPHRTGAVSVEQKAATVQTFGPGVVGQLGEKGSGSFQLGSPECQAMATGGSSAKDKALQKSGSSDGHTQAWHRKQMPYRKTEKGPDWALSHQQQQQQQQHQQQQQQQAQLQNRTPQASPARSRSADPDPSRAPAAQQPKASHQQQQQQQLYVSTQTYRDCSHPAPPPTHSPLTAKPLVQDGRGGGGGGSSCSLQRDGQKVARIRHQQHSRAGSGTPSLEVAQTNGGHDPKRKLDLTHNSTHSLSSNANQNPTHPHSHPSHNPNPNHSHSTNHNPNHNHHNSNHSHNTSHNPNANLQYSYARQGHQTPEVQPWISAPQRPESQRQPQPQQSAAYMNPVSGPGVRQHPAMIPPAPIPPGAAVPSSAIPPAPSTLAHRPPQGPLVDSGPMKNLLKYTTQQPQQQQPQQQPPQQQQAQPLSQKTPFGGLGSLKASCSLQGTKPVLQPRRSSSSDSQRVDCGGGRGRELSEAVHGEGEVRQPPVGIAVAVARQREPPCRLTDSQPRGRGPPAAKELPSEDDRLRMRDHMALHRDPFIRDNKDRLEFARIHPSNSCHGDFSSHLMGSGGSALQEQTAHAHSAHHHWMAQTGNPSLWVSGHSYSLSHSALHQSLPPGFPASVPPPLQPVLPLPQDPPALVMLPPENTTHTPSHLDVMDSSALWPPVFRPQAPAHMQHPAVFSRQQLLRQQELYALQQQQQHQSQQPHRNNHVQVQRKPEEGAVELQDILSEPRSPTGAPHFYNQSGSAGPTTHLSPCCQSPCLRPHPQSAPSTPCSAISPSPSLPPKSTEPQGQPPHDYPQSLEPDLPPGYTYPAMNIAYRGDPSPQDVPLAEPADLNAIQAEPTEHDPPTLSGLGEEFECQTVRPLQHQEVVEAVEEGGIEEEEEEKEVEDEEKQLSASGVVAVECVRSGSVVIGCCAPLELDSAPHPVSPAAEAGASAGDPACEPAVTFDPLVTSDPSVTPTPVMCEPAEIPKPLVTEEPSDACELPITPPSLTTHDSTADPDSTITLEPEDTTSDSTALCDSAMTSEPLADCKGSSFEASEQQRAEEPLEEKSISQDAVCGDEEEPRCDSLSCWSLELLIAAAFCGDAPPPSPAPLTPSSPPHHGMELLSELAELQLQQHTTDNSQEGEGLTFDLRSLATLAVARALELGSVDKLRDAKPCLARRAFNLRRKCSWTPRHEQASPVKAGMEAGDGEELAMRVRLAELQRRYREKQRELAKLQRKHENQKEEPPRSPIRRGPGRPRKRKLAPSLSSAASSDPQRRAKSVSSGFSLSGGAQKKRAKLSSQDCGRLSSTESSSVGREKRGLEQQVCVMRQRQSRRQREGGAMERHTNTTNESEGQSDTDSWQGGSACKSHSRRKSRASSSSSSRPQLCRSRHPRGSKQEVMSPSDSQSSGQEDEEVDSYDSDDGQDHRAPLGSEVPSALPVTGATPSSVVKLEANQKARKKRERQELYGSVAPCGADEEVKVRRSAPCGGEEVTAVKRKRGRPRRDPADLLTSSSSSERMRRAMRRSTVLRRSSWSATCDVSLRSQRSRDRQARSVSKLLKSLAADEDFMLEGDSSFSEEDSKVPLPNCVLTKELLVEGLSILISKEDELLYAAKVHNHNPPDFYSVVIDGEKGGHPKIYSREKLLQGAVLNVCPKTEAMLREGTRVCAYWSERSRCLYPGHVRRGVTGAGADGKAGGVMVEFDDGDRGRIALAHIRLLPPSYLIQYVQPERLLLDGFGTGRQTLPLSQQNNMALMQKPKRGRPKGSGKKKLNTSMSPVLSWPSASSRRCQENLFQLGLSRTSRFPPPPSSTAATPMHSIFSSCSFEVDSFSSIARSYSCTSFCGPAPRMAAAGGGHRDPGASRRRHLEEVVEASRGGGRRSEFLVKLDHEGMTAPKTKSSKVLQAQRGGGGVSRPEAYTHPVLLVEENRRNGHSGPELLLKGALHHRKLSPPPPSLQQRAKCDQSWGRSCGTYVSAEEEGGPKRAGPRAVGQYLSRLSHLSSSSSSCSSSSSGSSSSSSLCSSDNDSSWSSDEDEGSPPTILLRSCIPSQHALLPPPTPPTAAFSGRSFVAKALAMSSTSSSSSPPMANGKPPKRSELPLSLSSPPAHMAKRPRLQAEDCHSPCPGDHPGKQQWKWVGTATQRRGLKGRARKLFYKAVCRGRETVRVGDCAVFLSAGRPQLPQVGRIQSFWESWSSSMVVRVRWLYHPQETGTGRRHREAKHALYQSSHEDENDVQTISHKCQVLSREEYERVCRSRKSSDGGQEVFYLAGTYDPGSGQMVTAHGLSIFC
ncbi:hypothetical protein ACEWY4_003709 [Coilia grayii]|uniref:BAH domain-containing protein n=1 Tax=Coilia grayii TaxID=363190 RepID=A0ABD1KS35_9TELE